MARDAHIAVRRSAGRRPGTGAISTAPRARGGVFGLGLALGLPATMLMLCVNLVLGFASRVAPQLSIFSVGFPVTLLAGLSVLALGTEHLLPPMTEAMRVFLAPLR